LTFSIKEIVWTGEQAGKFACCILGQGTKKDASTFKWLDN